ncbi:MAG: endonuclease III [Isosphaeraceae bacterium]
MGRAKPPEPADFDVDEAFRRLREMTEDLPPAGAEDLRQRGHGSPFEVLVSALISTRTRDEMMVPVSLRLFAEADTPAKMVALGSDRIGELIRGVGFADVKSRDIAELSRRILEEHGGQVPETMEGLIAFRGIGPKVAALTLAVGFGKAAICVDVHVHRITNRWGYVETRTPEQTMAALEAKLPLAYYAEINRLLVPFGKHVCTGARPKCSTCLLNAPRLCRRVGVVNPR